MSFDPDPTDELIVATQLGRAPKARWQVAARCHLGVPMAIENHPLAEDGTPFPTRFWLSCPVLVKRISTLEAGGALSEISDELGRRPELKERLSRAIARLIQGRDAVAHIEDSGAPPGGGPDKVKCLHAHVAHELSDPPNPVGSIALERTGWPDCRVPCVTVQGAE